MKNIAAPIDGTFNATAALTLDSIKGLVAFLNQATYLIKPHRSITTNIFLTRPYLPVRPTLLTMDTGDGSVSKSFIVLVIVLTFLSFFFL